MTTQHTHKIAIFASGKGSNAEAIIQYFESRPEVEVALIVSNRKDAGVLDIARKYGVEHFIISKDFLYKKRLLLQYLKRKHIQWVVLAGFLWLVPEYLVQAYPSRMVNIHPALLPEFGGKGMYGMRVHQAVIDAGKEESGITIHFVNEVYDEGEYIFQAKVPLAADDTPETLAQKIHQLEHEHFPRQLEKLILQAGN